MINISLRCCLAQLACERPENLNRPVSSRDLWTYASLADAFQRETGRRISTSEVGRILRFERLRPHKVWQWLKSTDPDFEAEAKRVCDLYLSPPKAPSWSASTKRDAGRSPANTRRRGPT